MPPLNGEEGDLISALNMELQPQPEPQSAIPSPITLDLNPDTPKTLVARAPTKTYNPGEGSINPETIHNGGLMALFALLGAAFVIASIWFFFWAKNGGFVWRKGDWEEYKSTVLRRKGPDGRTLSNATKSTDLGGGSIVDRRFRDDFPDHDGESLGYSYTYTYTDETGTVGNDHEHEKRSQAAGTEGKGWKQRLRETAKQKFMRRRNRDEEEHQPWGEKDVVDEDVRAYRNEKPAQVGGMNRQFEGTYHGSDYDSSYFSQSQTQSEMTERRDYAYPAGQTARSQSHRSRGHSQSQRRDFSFAPESEDIASQIPSETQRLHEQDHEHPSSPPRRNNRRRERERRREMARERAMQRERDREREREHDREPSPRKRDRRSVPGHYSEPLDFSSTQSRSEYQYSSIDMDDGTGTKSYHHPIPGLTKGYRRDGGGRRRRDSLDDSD